MARSVLAMRGMAGLGFEATGAYGTAVARTAFTRFLEFNIERDHGEEHPQTSRLPTEEDAVLGDYGLSWSGRFELRSETVGAWLRAHAGVGSVTTTTPGGATNARQHVFVPTDERQPVTLERRLGTFNKSTVVDGGIVRNLDIELQNSLVVIGAGGLGRKDLLDQAPTTPTFDANAPLAKHQCVVKVAGAQVGARTFRAHLARETVDDDFEVGSRYRQDADIGAVESTFEFEAMFRDLSHLKRSLGNPAGTGPADDPLYQSMALEVTGPLIEATFYHKLTLSFPRTWWKPIGLPTRGRDAIMQRVQAKVLHDEASGYPWQATLVNTQTAI